MTDWQKYLNDKEPSPVKKKKRKGPGCKRNKISNKINPNQDVHFYLIAQHILEGY